MSVTLDEVSGQQELLGDLRARMIAAGTAGLLRLRLHDPWDMWILTRAVGEDREDDGDPDRTACSLAAVLAQGRPVSAHRVTAGGLVAIADIARLVAVLREEVDQVRNEIVTLHDDWLDANVLTPWLRIDDPQACTIIEALHRLRGLIVAAAEVPEATAEVVDTWAEVVAKDEEAEDHDTSDLLVLMLLQGEDPAPVPPHVDPAVVERLRTRLGARLDRAAALADFERSAVEFYTLLGQIVDRPALSNPGQGTIPTEVVERVEAQDLDLSLLAGKVELRRFQSFGARFAIAQERVILGDSPGLGKTVQAIAAIAHVTAQQSKPGGIPPRCVIVCPLGVLANWERELEQHSRIVPLTAYRDQRVTAFADWIESGGTLLTTFESLRALDFEGLAIDQLVVDEAHFAKNPGALRSQHVAALCRSSARVMLLTGTALENRLDDLTQLLGLLDDRVAASVRSHDHSPARVREDMAPRYLRRRVVDVLDELPGLSLVDEILPLSHISWEAYHDAVEEGNFMGMRQAAYLDAADPMPTKLARIEELVDRALSGGESVLVFSFFRGVLDLVHGRLGERVLGQITGDTPAAERVTLPTRLGSEGPAVLLCQVDAGGTGLNMTAASVVILCEPQLKPSTEMQAVARAHRMGQVREVTAHRLIANETVEVRLVDLVDAKLQVFEDFADDSIIAGMSDEAVDPSVSPAQLIKDEQQRLAVLGRDVGDGTAGSSPLAEV